MKRNIFFFIAISFGLIACSTTPTGRRQLRLLPESQLSQMGAQSFEKMKKEKTVTRDPRKNRYVRCIADAITKNLEDPEQRTGWEVVVFDDPAVNAFTLPGKKIGVFTGIIETARSADQLAAVMGHEVGHVLASHGNERVSQAFLAQGGLLAAQIALKENGKNRDLLFAALGLGMQFGVLLPFSRKHESEADEIGQRLMAQAGFNPEQAVAFWAEMQKKSNGQPPELLSTHPAHKTRIRQLKAQLPEVVPLYDAVKAKGGTPKCTL